MEGKYLPWDVHMIILAHLPVKSLLRCKSVCKAWRTIIENHDFIDLQRSTREAKNSGDCVLIMHYYRTSGIGTVFGLIQSNETGIAECVNLELPFFSHIDTVDITVAVPCNGILCMSDGEDIVLWNPAIREFKLLPRATTDLEYNYVGFGFDPSSNDYKVVRIWYGWDILKVEVYSLKTDSWISVNSIPTVSIGEFLDGQVYLNGKYYWCIMLSSDQYKIQSFDMTKGVFEEIELPSRYSYDYVSWDRLVVVKDLESQVDEVLEVIDLPEGRSDNGSWDKLMMMKDSLAMVSSTCSVNEKCFFHIWVLKESSDHALRTSWRKFFTIGPFYAYDSPLGYRSTSWLVPLVL